MTNQGGLPSYPQFPEGNQNAPIQRGPPGHPQYDEGSLGASSLSLNPGQPIPIVNPSQQPTSIVNPSQQSHLIVNQPYPYEVFDPCQTSASLNFQGQNLNQPILYHQSATPNLYHQPTYQQTPYSTIHHNPMVAHSALVSPTSITTNSAAQFYQNSNMRQGMIIAAASRSTHQNPAPSSTIIMPGTCQPSTGPPSCCNSSSQCCSSSTQPIDVVKDKHYKKETRRGFRGGRKRSAHSGSRSSSRSRSRSLSTGRERSPTRRQNYRRYL